MSLYNQSLALLLDLYQLTMCYGYWKSGHKETEAVFHLFFRRAPFGGGFTVAAGLEQAIDFLKNFGFDTTDLAYLETLRTPDGDPLFPKAFLDYLSDLKLNCDIDAVAEGTVVFPFEPLIRVKGPLIQCQLLESPLLNLINFPTLIATKAARVCLAAGGDEVMEFGLRRAQGTDGAITASRSAYIGGCNSTSNVLAGKLFGIPVKGTHSHSWVMAFDEEVEAFYAFADALPSSCVFLVDTYNTLEGVKRAIEVGKWLRKRGKEMIGIRLDSGDLSYLSIESRKLLDTEGFPNAKIIASNELDETLINDLKQQGAKIAVWGVGTNLVTGQGQPALDGIYKLSAVRSPGERWKYKLKLSEQMSKVTNPGILQVRRYRSEGLFIADVIFDEGVDFSKGCTIVDPLDPTRQRFLPPDLESEELLFPIFQKGKCLYTPPPLEQVRGRLQEQLTNLHTGVKRFTNPHQYVVGMEQSLYALKVELIKKVRKQVTPSYTKETP